MTLNGHYALIGMIGAIGFASGAQAAASPCAAPVQPAAAQIESTALESTFGPVPKPAQPLHFAYVTKTLINQFWQDAAAGAKAEAARYGVTMSVQAAQDESSMMQQLNLAQTILSQKPDALLLSPQSDSNLEPVITAAAAAHIPTVVIDDARSPGASSYIGTNQEVIGAEAATYLHQVNPNGGEVAQIEGMAGSPNARARMKGFRDQLAKYGNLQLVASQPGNWDRLTALNATTTILRQHPHLVGIYANNDGMALGVYEAVKNAGYAGKIAVVGTDGIPEALKSIADGQMSATVAEFPITEGKLGVDVALRLLACQAIPAWVVSPNAVITKDNVSQYLDPKAP